MKNDLQPATGFTEDAAVSNRFWMKCIQTFNWGTFAGVHTFDISKKGHLFVGPSGAGKSTALDAHAALTTPPVWLGFNVAARENERNSQDRSAMSYVRGAWSLQTSSDTGEVASQFLRPNTTWSVIAESFRNDAGDVVTLAQVLYVRGRSIASGDVKRLHLVLTRDFDVTELQSFAESDFDVRKLRAAMPNDFITDRFNSYQERFRGLLGIDSEAALKLLHKTQSSKNLGDLNVFLRDFMLEIPQTFRIADDLVKEFVNLNDAHRAVVEAGRQIDTLKPARTANEELTAARAVRLRLDNLIDAVPIYREQRRDELLAAGIKALEREVAGSKDELGVHKQRAAEEQLKLDEMRARRAGLGGALIEDLELQVKEAQEERERRNGKREKTEAACKALGWTVPSGAFGPSAMVNLVGLARAELDKAHAVGDGLGQRRYEYRRSLEEKEALFDRLREEIRSMEAQPSNIPLPLLRLRRTLCDGLGLAESAIPFAGELLQIRPADQHWQPAIERVLRGFALSLIVADRHYELVSDWVNGRDLGMRLVYLRAIPQRAGNQKPGPMSLVRKLDVADHAHAQWLGEELKSRFDYECAESMQAFRQAVRGAVTLQGQVRHSATRHEKNDTTPIHDRRHWVIGFDNHARLELFREDARQAAEAVENLNRQLRKLEGEELQHRERLQHCHTVAGQTWADIDVSAMIARIESLNHRIDTERAERPELDEEDEKIRQQQAVATWAHGKVNTTQGLIDKGTRERLELEDQRSKLKPHLLATELPSALRDEVTARYQAFGTTVSLKDLGELSGDVIKQLTGEREANGQFMGSRKQAIEESLGEFVRNWPGETDGLDARLESIDDFLAKLHRLEHDRLPEFEHRFMDLLRRQSDQNLSRLWSRLAQERSDIRNGLESVNESLKGAQFNKGTFLTIESTDRYLEDVKLFHADLKAANSNTYSDDVSLAKERFLVLKRLVDRLASQQPTDERWRTTVLDVRQHIEFIARECDADGNEVQVYKSGAGQSGGQRQKLAATCLAAALRYKLGSIDGGLPVYSTVVLDEAFDKADPKFTALAMNIFVTFGFQMIVATPMRSVMTLEPFIGSASFVSIRDRKHSQARPIEYDEASSRLKLDGTEANGA